MSIEERPVLCWRCYVRMGMIIDGLKCTCGLKHQREGDKWVTTLNGERFSYGEKEKTIDEEWE